VLDLALWGEVGVCRGLVAEHTGAALYQRLGGLHAGADRGLDTTAVDAVASPVSGEHEVIHTRLVGSQPMSHRAGRGEHVALAAGRVRAPVLGGQPRRTRPT